jgi:hypothetical protein
MLSLPSEADIARDIGRDVDPDAIFAARRRLRGDMARGLGAALRETYRRMTTDGAYSPDAASAGRRALKNACSTFSPPPAHAWRSPPVSHADNATDRRRHCRRWRCPVRDRQANKRLLSPLSDDPGGRQMVLLQATVPHCLGCVRGRSHHLLSSPNPGRTGVIGVRPARPGPVQPAGGEGCHFVADTVLDLDIPARRSPPRGLTLACLRATAGASGQSAPNCADDAVGRLRDIVRRSLARPALKRPAPVLPTVEIVSALLHRIFMPLRVISEQNADRACLSRSPGTRSPVAVGAASPRSSSSAAVDARKTMYRPVFGLGTVSAFSARSASVAGTITDLRADHGGTVKVNQI